MRNDLAILKPYLKISVTVRITNRFDNIYVVTHLLQ